MSILCCWLSSFPLDPATVYTITFVASVISLTWSMSQVQEEVSTLRREVSQKSEESRQRQSLLEKQIQELETRAISSTAIGG